MIKGFEFVVGKPIPQAEAELIKKGYNMRVTKRNGKLLQVDMIYVDKRVNVAVERGIVTDVVSLG